MKRTQTKRVKSEQLKAEQFVEMHTRIFSMLDEEQKRGFELIDKSSLTLILGSFGTGKTALMCAWAALKLKQGVLKKVYISRPTFAKKEEDVGFLPGEIKDKLTPFVLPMLQNFEKFLGVGELEYYLNHNMIEMLPTVFFRGINIGRGELLILDECQNLGREAMKKTVTRIAKGGTIILAGDRRQTDLRNDIDSGLLDIIKFKHPAFSIIELTINHRDPIVSALTDFYDTLEGSK